MCELTNDGGKEEASSLPFPAGVKKRTFYLLVETVEQTLLVVLRDDLERLGREKVAQPILDFIRQRNSNVDRPT